MVQISSAATNAPAPDAPPRRDGQAKDLRFLETLQATLAGCGNEAVYSAAVHRVAAAFAAASACLAAYDPIADTLDLLHQARTKRVWDMDVLRHAVQAERTVVAGEILAVPIMREGSPTNDARDGAEQRSWGVLAIARSAVADAESPAYISAERQLLRGAAERIGAELEQRRVRLLDDVLDGLLRKTKPIDVYTHTLRELRRFIRYDHSASVMTMQQGVTQIIVRVEKVVSVRGETETLVDSPRRGREVRLTAAQTRYLNGMEGVCVWTNGGDGWRLVGVSDPDAAGLWRVLCLSEGFAEGSILCYPLIFGGQMLGILRLAARRAAAFDPVDQYARLLDRFARLLAVTLYRSELYHQSDRQLQAIKEIGRAITQTMPVDEICRQVLGLALRVLHVGVGAVGLLAKEGTLELVAHQGCTLAQPPVLVLGDGISGQVVRTGTSWAVPDVTREPAYVVFNGRVRSELVAPIIYDREVIGFLDVESFEEGRFREEDEEVITFLEALANQAAIAIKAAQIHSEAVERLGASLAIDPTLSMAGLQDLLIEELRHKIEQLAATNERLAAASRAKSEFLAHMNHDLRSPLNVMVGLSNLLLDPKVSATLTPEKQRQSLELIRANGDLLGSLIGNILDLSVVEAGKVQLAVAPFDAAPAFAYLRAVATTQAVELHKELDISVAVHPAIGKIIADEEKFLRIMNNLLSNAVKFTPLGGRVVVMATVDVVASEVADVGAAAPPERRSDVPERRLHITVSDTGSGIAVQDQERVFEAFQQIDSASSREHHGTGLGLAVVRRFVESHGGHVWLESTPGHGSTFHVVLPNALPADGVEVHVDRPATPIAPRRRDALSVLVVEDIPAHMNVMRLALTSYGHTMHGVGSGEEALDWLSQCRPDVILLDIQLPGRDGFSVAEQLKGQVETHTIPIIAVTADALSVTEERARASGCDAYLTKPIDVAKLLAAIDAVVSSQ